MTTSASSSTTPSSISPTGTSREPTSPVAGSKVTVTLRSGATLRLPGGATRRDNSVAKAVKSVARSHLFQMDDPGFLLSISELTRLGHPCKERLDTEWERMEKAKAETSAQRLALRQVVAVDQLQVDGHRVLYTEARQRAPGPSDAGRLWSSMASATLCRGDDLAVVMFAGAQPELPRGTRSLLEGIVASYRPAP